MSSWRSSSGIGAQCPACERGIVILGDSGITCTEGCPTRALVGTLVALDALNRGGGGSEWGATVHTPPDEVAPEPQIALRRTSSPAWWPTWRASATSARSAARSWSTSRRRAACSTRSCRSSSRGRSAAGKSATVERVLRFFPEDALVPLTGMSEHFLAYDERPIKHKMLVLYEAAGMSGEHATYLIRTLLSEGVIRHGTVERDRTACRPGTWCARARPG